MSKRNPMTDRVLAAIGADTKTSTEIAQALDVPLRDVMGAIARLNNRGAIEIAKMEYYGGTNPVKHWRKAGRFMQCERTLVNRYLMTPPGQELVA